MDLPKMTKEHFEKFGVKSFRDVRNISIEQINELGDCFKEITVNMERYSNRQDCSECKKSMASDVSCVCEYHFHDYVVLCDRSKCKNCWLIRQFLSCFTDQIKEFENVYCCIVR